MTTIDLIPKKAVLHILAGNYATNMPFHMEGIEKKNNDDLVFEPRFTEAISYRVVSPASAFEHVRLSTDENFSEFDGQVYLRRSVDPNTDRHVGTLTYLDDASFGVSCELPPHQFDELINAARAGRVPSEITVSVIGEGAESGWEPDGRGLEWDNEEHPRLLVDEITFELPYAGSNDQYDFDEQSVSISNAMPASKAQMEKLLQRIDEIRKAVVILVGIAIFVSSIYVGNHWGWFE